MNCEKCMSGVYEPVGYLHLQLSGQVYYEPSNFINPKIQAINVSICSLCGEVKLQSNNNMLSNLKREIREFELKTLPGLVKTNEQ